MPDIPDKHPAGLAVEAVPEWITQSKRPDFSSRSGDANEGIIWRNRVGPGRGINVNAEHFAEQSRQTLRIAARFDVACSLVVCAAAVPGGDVHIVRVAGARTEADPSSVMIGLRVIEGKQDSFTARVRDVWIGRHGKLRDVRHATREEIDVQQPTNPGGGENYGWRVREGSVQNPVFPGVPRPPGAVDPIFDYPRSVGQTVIGGYVYRGKRIPNLRGVYVFADYLGPDSGPGTGQIFTLNYNGTIASNFQNITTQLFPTRPGGFTLSNPSSLGEDANGELYITDISNGSVFEIVRIHGH